MKKIFYALLMFGVIYAADTTVTTTAVCKFRSREFAGFKSVNCVYNRNLFDTIGAAFNGLGLSGQIILNSSSINAFSLPDTLICAKVDSVWQISEWYAPCNLDSVQMVPYKRRPRELKK